MNALGVAQERAYCADLISILDDSIPTIFDIAEETENKILLTAAEKLEKVLETLVTRELELERVQEVLNCFELNTSVVFEDI